MSKSAYIEVKLTLLTTEEDGKRKSLTLDTEKAFYRPHIVVGDAGQRKPILKNGNIIDEEHLGVQFRPCPITLKPGDSAKLILDLMYYPSISYNKVIPKAEFTLREGSQIVGFGQIISVNFDS